MESQHEKRCCACRIVQPTSNFYKNRAARDGLQTTCKQCQKDTLSSTPREKRAAYYAAWLGKPGNREAHLARQRQRDKERAAVVARREISRGRLLRKQVVARYGGRCACCGVAALPFLAIDHEQRDGASRRRQDGDGRRLCARLIRLGYPAGYRVLCHNCNVASYYHSGICPHEIPLTDEWIKAAPSRREKKKAVTGYGGVCQCCGESDIRFLSFDHINGDGAEYKRQYGSLPLRTYVIRLGFPSSIRLLCFNCNSGREVNKGTCPHEEINHGNHSNAALSKRARNPASRRGDRRGGLAARS